jgi:hypothetical protein
VEGGEFALIKAAYKLVNAAPFKGIKNLINQ